MKSGGGSGSANSKRRLRDLSIRFAGDSLSLTWQKFTILRNRPRGDWRIPNVHEIQKRLDRSNKTLCRNDDFLKGENSWEITKGENQEKRNDPRIIKKKADKRGVK